MQLRLPSSTHACTHTNKHTHTHTYITIHQSIRLHIREQRKQKDLAVTCTFKVLMGKNISHQNQKPRFLMTHLELSWCLLLTLWLKVNSLLGALLIAVICTPVFIFRVKIYWTDSIECSAGSRLVGLVGTQMRGSSEYLTVSRDCSAPPRKSYCFSASWNRDWKWNVAVVVGTCKQ